MYAEGAPIPLVIYRVNSQEAYQLGVWANVGPPDLPPSPFFNLRDAESFSTHQSACLKNVTLPPLQQKPIGALTNLKGIRRSHKEHKLWLLHPQSNELSLYRGEPILLALWQSYGFYEAYLPHNSSVVPHEWLPGKTQNTHSQRNKSTRKQK